MAVTIEEIARRAGVSRGTVDRALHKRGRIRPEVAENIRKIAEEMGYKIRPRKTSERSGAGSGESIKIGVVTQLTKSAFMIQVNQGIQDAGSLLKERGARLLCRNIDTIDEEKQLAVIDELVKEGIDGLALMPIQCESIRARLNQLSEERGIPVITFNSDIVGTGRTCFVGLDNKQSGRAAAGLMGMMTRGQGKILAVTGYFTNSVNSLRIEGFIREMKETWPQTEILGVQSSFDDAGEMEKIVINIMTMVPDLAGIFVASAGQEGVWRAFEQLGISAGRRPGVIVYDLTRENVRALEEGWADFLIDQEAYVQGNLPPKLLFDILARDKWPQEEFLFTEINIKTRYNL